MKKIRGKLIEIGHKFKCEEIISRVQGITKFESEHIEASCDAREGGLSYGV